MERLTTDNPQNNTEVALNLVYVKDGQAWVRNGGPDPGYPDVTLYDYMRLIIADHGPMSFKADITDDEIGDALDDALFDGIETKEGLCAMLYTLAWASAELRQRLAAYEDIGTPEEFLAFMNTGMTPDEYAKAVKDLASALATDSVFRHQFGPDRAREIITAETEDRLLVLPCAPGNIVWALERDMTGAAVDFSGYMFLAQTRGSIIVTPFVNGMDGVQNTLDYLENDTRISDYADLAVFPARDVYLTREEAEEKLREDNNEKTQSV